MKRLLAVVGLSFLAGLVNLQAQSFGSFSFTAFNFTNTTTSVASTVNLVGTGAQRNGLTIAPKVTGRAAGATDNVVFKFDLAIDATASTYSTTVPLTATVTGNGTTAVVGVFHFDATNFLGVTGIQLTSVVNTNTNGFTCNAVTYHIPGQ